MAVPESLQVSQEFWNAAAETYEHVFTGTFIGKLWRDSVWRELDAQFQPGSRVLELNCGTGLDAIHLAQRGVSVLACDISPRMIELARWNALCLWAPVSQLLDFRVLATEHLAKLEAERLFDGAFSNFSGLNCVQDISAVSRNLAKVVKPGAPVFLCMLGRCWLLGGLWRLAGLHSTNRVSRKSRVNVYRPSRKQIGGFLAPHFKLRRWKGIGIAVPPSYMEGWAVRLPRFTRALDRIDQRVGDLPVFRSLGGCTLFELERTARDEGLHEGISERA